MAAILSRRQCVMQNPDSSITLDADVIWKHVDEKKKIHDFKCILLIWYMAQCKRNVTPVCLLLSYVSFTWSHQDGIGKITDEVVWILWILNLTFAASMVNGVFLYGIHNLRYFHSLYVFVLRYRFYMSMWLIVCHCRMLNTPSSLKKTWTFHRISSGMFYANVTVPCVRWLRWWRNSGHKITLVRCGVTIQQYYSSVRVTRTDELWNDSLGTKGKLSEIRMIIYLPLNGVELERYIGFTLSIRLSICPSVCLSVCL